MNVLSKSKGFCLRCLDIHTNQESQINALKKTQLGYTCSDIDISFYILNLGLLETRPSPTQNAMNSLQLWSGVTAALLMSIKCYSSKV